MAVSHPDATPITSNDAVHHVRGRNPDTTASTTTSFADTGSGAGPELLIDSGEILAPVARARSGTRHTACDQSGFCWA